MAAMNYEEALQAAYECLASDPSNDVCLHGRLFALLHLKRYDEAIDGSEDALAMIPTMAANPTRAVDYKEFRRAVEAIRSLAVADRCYEATDVQIEYSKTEDWPSVVRQATIADAACESVDRVTRARVWSRAVTAHEKSADYAAMLAAADRCISIDPLYIICHAERTQALLHLQRFEDATKALSDGRARVATAKARIEGERSKVDPDVYEHQLKGVEIGVQLLDSAHAELTRAQALPAAKRVAIDSIGGSERTSRFHAKDGAAVRQVTFDGTEMLSALSRSMEVVPLGSEDVDVVVQLDWYVEPTDYDDCRWTMVALVQSRSEHLGEVMHSGWRPCGEVESRLARSSRLIAERLVLARTVGLPALADPPLEADIDLEALNEYRVGMAQIESAVDADYRRRQRQLEARQDEQRALFQAAANLSHSIGGEESISGGHFAPSCFSDGHCPAAEHCLKPRTGSWGRCGTPSPLNTAPGGYAKSCTNDSDCTGGRCLGTREPRVCGDY